MPIFTRRARYVLVALLMTFSLAAAACNSGGGGSNDSSDAPARDADAPAGFGDSPGSTDAEFFNSSNCLTLQDAFNGRSYDGSSDSLEETADFLRDAADNAPEEVVDDLRVLADVYEQFVDIDSRGIRRNPDFVEATVNLSRFVAATCAGLGLDG